LILVFVLIVMSRASDRYLSVERDSLEFNSFEKDEGSVSTAPSTSVIGTLMKRFREAAPAPPDVREAPVKKEEMWWISGKNGRQVDTIIRESIDSGNEGIMSHHFISSQEEDGGSPKPRAMLGFGATMRQRHDGGNLPRMHRDDAAIEPTLQHRSQPVQHYPSMSMSALSNSMGFGSIGDTASIEDLDEYADALLEKCDAFIGYNPNETVPLNTDQNLGNSNKRANLAQELTRESIEQNIRYAHERHLKQSSGNDSPVGKEVYEVEVFDVEDGSPVNTNLQWQRIRHNTITSNEGDAETEISPKSEFTRSEMKNTSELIFPAKSPQSPPRVRVSPEPRRHQRQQQQVQYGQGNSSDIRSTERDSSIFPMYLSSSGDITAMSTASSRKAANQSAFSLVEVDGDEVKVSLNASQILKIPEEDEEVVYEDSSKGGHAGYSSPTLFEQSADGEVRVSISYEAVRTSQSQQLKQARVELSDVEPYLSDKVLAHLWQALCEVRRHIHTVSTVGAE
jgi:hypothetical protein